MKNLLALLAITIVSLGQTMNAQGSGWELVYNEVSELGVIKGICFVPGSNNLYEIGWAAKYNGIILKTIDGGDTWTEQTQPYSTSLWGIDFADEYTGYVCDNTGQILKTTDGGINWNLVFTSPSGGFSKIKFKDINNGIVVGFPNHYYTSDGGATWTASDEQTEYWALDHAGDDTYYGVEAFLGNVGQTVDNGETWQNIHETGFGVSFCIDFLDLNYGLIGGNFQSVAITTDGANTWTNHTVDDSSGEIISGAWFDKDSLWLCGTSIFKSTNGGESWSVDTSMWDDGISNREMEITGLNTIYVSGDDLLANVQQIWRKKEPEPLYPDFIADDTVFCAESTVNYEDMSIGTVITWDWTFEGGNPSSSTEENPTVTYSTPGYYDVTLSITNNFRTETITKTHYISALETPTQANIPTGEVIVCSGELLEYSTDQVMYAQEYDWEITPGEAGTVIENENEASIQFANDWTGDFTLKVRATNICGDGDWSDELAGTVFQSPDAFSLMGGGSFCEGGDGVEIILDASQTGFDYELLLNDVPTGNIVAGTGNEISFGLITEEGHYIAVGSNDNCTTYMENEVEVDVLNIPESPGIPDGPIAVCNEPTSDYSSEGSEDADTYVWLLSPEEAGTITATDLEAIVSWNNEFTGIATVSLYGINDCGEGEASEELEVNIGATIPQITGEEMVCDFSDEIYIATENDGSTYTWVVTGGTISEGQGTYMITVSWTGEGFGTITVDEETADGCSGSSEEFAVVIDDCTAIGENELLNSIKVFPNPASTTLAITAETQVTSVNIYSLTGQLMLAKEDFENNQTVDISKLESGLYLIRIQTDLGTVSKKLIIE